MNKLLKGIQSITDRIVLHALDPRSKSLTPEGKARLKELLEKKKSGVWDRRKARWREGREKAKIQREQERI